MKAVVILIIGLLAGCASSTNAPPTIAPSPSVDAMSVSIQNGTTLVVKLVVNGVPVATLQPGACLGCADPSVPASNLPALPWNVEARSPSGRVLVAMTVHEGDVIQTANSWKGDANRVDLSCGRIDIWSGPPLLGPPPGSGSPGDCVP